MLNFEPNIVFIDDQLDEVLGIVDEYRKEGVGVKYFNADNIDGEDKPATPYSDVNLIFLDLYLDNIKPDFDIEICGEWVKSVIPEYAFYVLVIWSKDTQHKDDVLQHMGSINRPPYLCIEATKNDGFKNEDNSWNFQKLYAHVNTEIAKKPELEELALWKKSIKASSNLVVGHLAKDSDSHLDKKLQKIIVGHGGTSLQSSGDAKQKREALFDALDNVLTANAKGTRPLKDISEANSESLYSIPENIQTDIDSKLNSWFHFELHNEDLKQDIIAPGLICEFNDTQLREKYGVLTGADKNIKEYLSKQMVENGDTDNTPTCLDICMLISRPCDIAQNKYGKNLKLISGVMVINPIRKTGLKRELKTGVKCDSVKLFDHLTFSENRQDVSILFDFRYIFSVPVDDFKDKFTNIKVFNKELISEIQVEYSSYSSRLGITQII